MKTKILYSAAGALVTLTAIAAFVSPPGAWPLAAIAVALVFTANIDRFSEFSASSTGITAKVREAQGAINDLKRMIEVVGAAELHQLQSSKRWNDGDSDDEKRIYDSIISLMVESGVSHERIKEIKSENWDKFVRFDYVLAILGGGYIPKSGDAAVQDEWKKMRDFENVPTPSKLASFLARHGDDNEARQRLLESYEQYYASGKHLNEEVWRRRNDVPQIGIRAVPAES